MPLRSRYAMSGTDVEYAATSTLYLTDMGLTEVPEEVASPLSAYACAMRCPVSSTIGQRACYVMSGTDIAYAGQCVTSMLDNVRAWYYAIASTDVVCGAIDLKVFSANDNLLRTIPFEFEQ
eukprot:1612930-Rhodomonas_salina.12